MQIHQILIRPQSDTLIILYTDVVGRRETITEQISGNSVAQQLVQQCETKLPADTEHPAKDEIEQEIDELEYRLKQLKQSIGVPA